MKNSAGRVIESIKKDKELQPLFFDYIGENIKTTMADFYKVDTSHRLKLKSAASKTLIALVKELESKVGEEDPYLIIEHVCKYYMTFISIAGGRIFHLDE